MATMHFGLLRLCRRRPACGWPQVSRDQLDIDVTDLTPVEAADMIRRLLDVRHHQ